jgi:hypothetical protein
MSSLRATKKNLLPRNNILRRLNSYRINQRPAFVIRSGIEDAAVFSGIYRSEPLIAAIDAMIADENAYVRFSVAHAPIPT